MYSFKSENSWREHQENFIARKRRKSLISSLFKSKVMACLPLITFMLTWHYMDIERWLHGIHPTPGPDTEISVPHPVLHPIQLTRSEVQAMIADVDITAAEQNVFFHDSTDTTFRIETSLDMNLMTYLNGTMDHLKAQTRGKPRQIGIVVMDARSGHILAMSGFDTTDPEASPCLRAAYPAASVFKIVTAAAAVDALGYTPTTPLYFNGNKYTLYKSQIKETRDRHTVTVPFANAFAESINPVFGKIGQTYLGRDKLSEYAQAFGFNQTADADFAFEPGVFLVHEDSFHLAELGSGYNRETRISPVFGAMMITPILNDGKALIPALVNRVTNADGEAVYTHKPEHALSPIRPESARALMQMMEKTVTHGTARRSFGKFDQDKVLSGLSIGGKTGSLSNKEYTIKYDWFTGFGQEKAGERAIVFSIVVGHGKYIGTRAAAHARNILKCYFQTPAAPAAGEAT